MESLNSLVARDQRTRAAALNASLPAHLRGSTGDWHAPGLTYRETQMVTAKHITGHRSGSKAGRMWPEKPIQYTRIKPPAPDHDETDLLVRTDALDRSERTPIGSVPHYDNLEESDSVQVDENQLGKPPIAMTVRLDRVDSHNRAAAKDFFDHWPIDKQKNPFKKRLLEYHLSRDKGARFGNDVLVIIDSNGRHELIMPVFAAAISPTNVNQSQIHFTRPEDADSAKEFLDQLNTLKIGNLPVFDELKVVDKIPKAFVTRKPWTMSEAGHTFLKGAVWKSDKHPEIPRPIVPQKVAEVRPVAEAAIVIQNGPLPNRIQEPFSNQFHQILALEEGVKRRVQFNLFLLNNHIGLSQENGRYIISCTDKQSNLIRPLQQECAKLLGLPTWIRIKNKAETGRSIAASAPQKILQPA